MKYKKIEKSNYDIYLINTKKFKTINISTILINDYKKEDVTKEKFISEYLLNSNNNQKDEVLMNKKYMELYEPRISISDMFRNVHAKIFDITFLNEKYTEKGMNKKTIDFYSDIIFNPNTFNNSFDETSFNIIKDSLKSMYLIEEEDSSSKAYFSAIKNISEDSSLKIDTRGNIDDLEKLNKENCYDYYKKELKNSKFVIFITGDINDELINIINDCFENKVNYRDYEIQTKFNINKIKEAREVIEESTFKQSIVYIIYKIFNMTKREKNIVLPVFNNILGGSSAKLFNNVREKNSMAYYAYSEYFPAYNIFYMYAGISKDNYESSVKLMKKELEEIKKGNITDEEINGAKESLYSALLKSEDSIIGVSNNLKGKIIFNALTSEKLKKEYYTVTKDEVAALANKLDLDVTYLLKGEN